MKEDLEDRIRMFANHILQTHDTIRKTANIYGYSKSTIHNDVSVRLRKLDFQLYQETKKVLDENFAEKHLCGGEATKKKYQEKEEDLRL